MREGEDDGIVDVYMEEDEDLEEDIVREEERAARRERLGRTRISAEEIRKVKKIHDNVGHPGKLAFLRMLRAGRVREEIVRWVQQEFRCPECEAHPLPKAPRPAVVPKTYRPGVALGIDLVFIPKAGDEQGAQPLMPAVNMVDLGTNFQMVEPIDAKEPKLVWEAMWRVWTRVFGLPEYVAVDEGTEFKGEFARLCQEAGIIVFTIASKAPWQQGRVERHGGLYKSMLAHARSSLPPASHQRLRLLMYEVEAAKNRFSNRSGYSPVQRQIGQWPRVPSSLMSDELLGPALQSQADADEGDCSGGVRQSQCS